MKDCVLCFDLAVQDYFISIEKFIYGLFRVAYFVIRICTEFIILYNKYRIYYISYI